MVQPRTLGDLQQVRGEPVLLALLRDQGEGEPRPDDGQVRPLAQQEGHGADVVFVAVGEHEHVDVVAVRSVSPGKGRRASQLTSFAATAS